MDLSAGFPPLAARIATGFGVDVALLEAVHHGADARADLVRVVATDGRRYAAKSSIGPQPGLAVAALLADRGVPACRDRCPLGTVAPPRVPAATGRGSASCRGCVAAGCSTPVWSRASGRGWASSSGASTPPPRPGPSCRRTRIGLDHLDRDLLTYLRSVRALVDVLDLLANALAVDHPPADRSKALHYARGTLGPDGLVDLALA